MNAGGGWADGQQWLSEEELLSGGGGGPNLMNEGFKAVSLIAG